MEALPPLLSGQRSTMKPLLIYVCTMSHYQISNKSHHAWKIALIVQTPNSPFRNFSCALRVSVASGSARGLLFDMEEPNTASVTQRLHENRELIRENPLAFLNILFEDHGRSCERHRAHLDREVVRMERRTGKTSIRLFSPAIDTDYEQLNKDLHACNTELIFLDNITNFEMKLGQFIKETLKKFEALRHESGISSESIYAYETLSSNMDYLINACEMRRYQAQSLHQRVKSQINVVSDMLGF